MGIVKKNIDLTKVKKILVIQMGPIGDAFLTTSYFQTLKSKFPNAELHYLIFKRFQKAINKHPLIDKTICVETKNGIQYHLERLRKIMEIRDQNYDLIIDQQNMQVTQFMTLLSGAKYKLGYADGNFSFAYNLKAERGERRYSASKKYDILAPLGIEEEKYELFFNVSEESKKNISDWLKENNLIDNQFICISPGSPVEKKKWKLENYIELGNKLYEKYNLPLVVVWAPNEIDDAEKVSNSMKGKAILASKTSLEEVVSLIGRARLLICNDGGLNHLAVAAKAKTLAIFGKTEPIDWSPASVFKTHHHLYNANISNKDKNSSFGISVDDAFKKILEIIGDKNG
ncbi:MAG: glycosyltransferase family 9 protein [Melioribacteraceae bacterium]|nr:glycosyltransferase family 9 protein [Melioribacteraceae bacterium]